MGKGLTEGHYDAVAGIETNGLQYSWQALLQASLVMCLKSNLQHWMI